MKVAKTKLWRWAAGLLTIVMLFAAVPETAFAWGYIGESCSSEYGARYVGSDGEYYYSSSVSDYIVYDDAGKTSLHTKSGGGRRSKMYLVESDGSRHYVYCVEAGVNFGYSDNGYTSNSGSNSRYFLNLPEQARNGIMMATIYGYQPGKLSPIPGTNEDDYAIATQTIIWEYQQQLRTSPTSIGANSYGIAANMYYSSIAGRPAEKCYKWILEQCAKHTTRVSFNGQTQTLKYNPSAKNYSLTLTDTNNTYADLILSGADGITVTRSGNQYTFTSSKMLKSPVRVTMKKNVPSVNNNLLIWGRPGWQTMICGSEDPVVMSVNLQTETYGSCKLIKKSEDGKVAGIKFRITGNGVDKTVATASDGTFTVSDLLPGTYTVAEIAEDRYVTQESKTITISSGQTAEVTFSNTLKRGDLKIEKICDDNLVEGLKFRVTASVIGYDKTFYTNKDGEIYIEDLQVYDSNNKLIMYTVEEIDKPKRYDPVPAQSATIIYGGEVALKFHNETTTQYAHILKVSEDGDIAGKRFRVTSDNGYDHVYTTNAGGTFMTEELPVYNTSDELILYTVTEIDTPTKFVQPESQSFTLENGDQTVKFTNRLKKFRVEVTKSDSVTGNRPQGDASLAGAKYGLFFDGELVDTFTTDRNGYFITPYYTCGDTWELKELDPSAGYLIDPESHHVGAEAKLYSVEYNTTENFVDEDVILGHISIIKHADDGSTQIETPEAGATFEVYLASSGSYANALESERDLLVCDEAGFAATKDLPYGRYIVHQTKGWEDTEFIPDFEVFVNEDGKECRYLINNAPFTSYLKIVKVDSETGKEIPYAGAAFQLYDAAGNRVVMHYTYPTYTEVDTFYTSSDGYLITPERLDRGDYKLVEVQAPYGYVLRRDPVEFTIDDEDANYEEGITLVIVNVPNAPQKGTIHIKKTGEVFSSVTASDGVYLPVYSVKGLAGAVFQIIADEDIYTPDGTLRAAKGTVVDTITTSESGEAVSKPLYLGKYRIVETKSPYGMLTSDEQEVELVYAGQFVQLTDISASIYNEREKVEIELEKKIEKDERFGIGTSEGDYSITFGLFAREKITAADGSFIPAGGLIEILPVTEEGTFSFTADIPFGKYYVKELTTAGPEYILDETEYPVEFVYGGQEIPVVHIALNDGEPIVNEILYGNVSGRKTDEFGENLAGALIGLFRPDETEFTRENAILTDVSDENGAFSFENIPQGYWLVAEIEQPEGFILSLDVHHIYVTVDGQVIPITMENEHIKGNVLLTKYDEDYPDNKLSGAVFEVYIDVNENGEWDEEDEFVAALEETEVGIYELKNLIGGQQYLIFEKTAPEGFELDENVYTFTITENGQTVLIENEAGVGFKNKAQRGSLVIEKSSEDGVLEGFEFVISGEDWLGNPYEETFVTDTEGRIEVELRPGDYTVSEKGSDETVRYVLPEDQTVTITANEESGLKFQNDLKRGSIELRKVDSVTGEPLAGVTFRIYNEKEELVAEAKTDGSGIVRFDDLVYGKYFWQEYATIDGYQLENSMHEFSVTEDGQLITESVSNDKIPDNPKTGDNTNLPLWFGLMGASGCSLLAMLLAKKRRGGKVN